MLAGRRVLIVLDNARDAAQVRPLLPGSGGCLVVVTSRSALAGLAAAEGARPLRLGPLADEEGVRLLAARLGPERVAAEPGAVAELAAWCGHLPLALAVMAARAAADPGLPLGVLAGQLAGAGRGRGRGRGRGGGSGAAGGAGDRGPGDQPAPAAVLVAPPAQPAGGADVRAAGGALRAGHHGPGRGQPGRRFRAPRRGGRWPSWPVPAWPPSTGRAGTCCTTWSAATPPEQARQALGEAGIRAAIERSLDHYLHTVIRPLPAPPPPFTVAPPAPGVLPEQLADEAALQDWARAEHQVVLQAIAQAAAAGFLTRAWQIFLGQALLVGGQGYWADFRASRPGRAGRRRGRRGPGGAGLDPRGHRQVRHVHRR